MRRWYGVVARRKVMGARIVRVIAMLQLYTAIERCVHATDGMAMGPIQVQPKCHTRQ